jgi:citrate/tricarballylate utilization protein
VPAADPLSLQSPLTVIQEGERIMRICNSCRYCEGFCAVFPAMERRLTFFEGDLNYLANLCHNCGECYYACQYAPPHEFAVNVPKLLAEIRGRSYRQYAWPAFLADAFRINATVAALTLPVSMLVWFSIARQAVRVESFYDVVSHAAMVRWFGGVSIFVMFVFAVGLARFWRGSGGEPPNRRALAEGLKDALTLRYLDGGGGGCAYPGEQQSQSRRWFHHCTFYGFTLCFASTVTAAFYHYALRLRAPYGYLSVPVLLGTFGGIGLAIGTIGLLWLKRVRNPAIQAAKQTGMDVAFLLLLLLSSVTGLLLLALRSSAGMPVLLTLHLGVVLTLFLTLPYGKFVHAIYRSAALVKYALERAGGIHR